MKKGIRSIICIVLCLSMLPITSFAAYEGLHNFKQTHTYRSGQFTDIAAGVWYEETVGSCYEIGLMNGNSATTFNPKGNITEAETLTIVARIHKIYNTGSDDFSDIKQEMLDVESTILEWCDYDKNSPAYKEFYNAWYAPYVYYCFSYIWPEGRAEYPQFPALAYNTYYAPFIDTKTPITRERFVSYLVGALPESEFKQINAIADGAIPDVKNDPNVYMLYRAGILTGNDDKGTFSPTSSITRAEVATIISRMVNPDLRKKVVAEEGKNEPKYAIEEKLKIYGTYIKVNSADGVSAYIQWENLSDKEIKYVNFNVELYNRVGDVLSCEIRGTRGQWLYQTGPIPQGKGNYNCVSVSSSGGQRPFQPDVKYDEYKIDTQNGWEGQYWDCAWYNSQAHHIKIVGVRIEYMDGTIFVENNRTVFEDIGIITLNVSDAVYEHVWKYPTQAKLLPKGFPYTDDSIRIDTLLIDEVTGVNENEALFTCRLQGYNRESGATIYVDVVDGNGQSVALFIPSIYVVGTGEFTTWEFFITTPISGTYYLSIRSVY